MRLEDAVRRLRENDPTLTELGCSPGHSTLEGEIETEGAVALADGLRHNSYLERLDLAWKFVGNEGATALADALCHNSTLKVLILACNHVGKEGATALAEALRNNSSLTALNLSSNHVGNEGATALADALCHNSTLKVLYLTNNNVGKELRVKINSLIETNRRDGPVLAAARKTGRFPEEGLRIPLQLLPKGIARIGRMDCLGAMFAFVRERHSDMPLVHVAMATSSMARPPSPPTSGAPRSPATTSSSPATVAVQAAAAHATVAAHAPAPSSSSSSDAVGAGGNGAVRTTGRPKVTPAKASAGRVATKHPRPGADNARAAGAADV